MPTPLDTPTPKVIVLLATYNGIAWVKQQILGILGQTGVSMSLIVSDDLSTDGTWECLLKLSSEHHDVRILPHGGKFGGAAKNFFRLLRDADLRNIDYVSFADQDDLWPHDKLLRAHQVLLRTGAACYSSNVTAFWPDGRKALIKKSQPQVQWDFLFEAAGPGCTYVMRKEFACAVQDVVRSRWDEMQEVGLHDWFVYAFARANGYRWVIDDVPSMLYRQHENNQVGVNAGWRAFVHRADKVFGGWGLAQSALIARLVGLGDDPFVLRWAGGGRLGLLYLALNAGHFRRRVRDKIIFGFGCLLLSITRRRRR
jgi:rhamnosyltransferase